MSTSRPGRIAVLGTSAVIAVIALVAAACGSSSHSTKAQGSTATTVGGVHYTNVTMASASTPHRGGSIVYAVEGESDGWNPTSARWTEPALTEANTVFDPLAAWGTHYNSEPYLAKSFTHSSDYQTWTIGLRSGITFHDGTPLDSAAVAGDLNAVRASTLTGAAVTPISSISTPDANTVVVHMSIPWSVFPDILTGQIGMIAAPSQVASGNTQHPVGTGPFIFSSWTPNATFVVNRNPHYWRAGLPYLDQITFKPIVDQTTMYNSLITGDIDMLETSLNQIQAKLATAAASGQVQLVYTSGETEETSVMLNEAVAPFNDLRVRQAVAYATDQQSWAKTVGVNPATLANGPFAPGSKWYIPTGYPTFDLAKAQALVKQVEAESGPIKFTLQCTADTTVAQTCQILQAQWEKAGMEVQISTVTEATLITNAVEGQYQASIWRQFGEQDPDADIAWWSSANAGPVGTLSLNMARNKDETIDNALKVGRTNPQPQRRELAYVTVARQLAKDLPYIWLSHTVWVVAARNNIRGLDQTTLPDGTKTNPVTSGVQRLGQIWVTG